MTTEPTQTPRTEAFAKKLGDRYGGLVSFEDCASLERELAKANTRIEILSEGKTCDKCVNPLVCNDLGKCGQVQMLQRDLALSTQRITALESQLRTQASELTEAVRLARKFDVETVHLQERVKQLEGALTDLSQWQSDDAVAGIGDYDQGLMCGVEDRGFQKDGYSAMRYGYDRALERVSERIDGVIQQALSPSPPAVERWAKEKEAHRAGKRIQLRARHHANEDWPEWETLLDPKFLPSTPEMEIEYRIHPDDDAPPVQTEEKAATVPLAVAEGQWQPRWMPLPPATFQASTKE